MAKVTSYLSQLSFDPSLLNSWQARFIKNVRVVVLLILTILLLGIVSFIQIPRRLNPEVKIPIVNIITVLPGGSPQDVESLVTIPLEESVDDIKGIDTLSSSSNENISVITIQFLSTIDGEKARDDVQSGIDSVNTLPEDAQTPGVTLLDFEDQPVWTFVLTGKGDTTSLYSFARHLKDKIEDVSKVDRVQISGLDTRVIKVTLKQSAMDTYGLSVLQLSQLVKSSTQAYPAGTINSSDASFGLSIDPLVTTIEELRNLVVKTQNSVVTLGDIADITEQSDIGHARSLFLKGAMKPKDSVQFFVYKTSGSNIDAAEEEAHKVVDETLEEYKGAFEVVPIMNTAEDIKTQFNELFSEFRSTIILVFLLLLLFLGWKQAIIASLTIPLTFLSAFAILQQIGQTLNFLTMFAFLLSLGLLIDDTIVVVAAMTRYYKTGKFTAYETGILVWKDFIVPLWSTTITTIWAFVPLLLSTGIIGEFIKPIPIVVTATMLSSTTIAVFITIPLMVIVLKPSLPRRVKTLLLFLCTVSIVGFIIAISPKTFLLPFIVLATLALLWVLYISRDLAYQSMQGFVNSHPTLKKILRKSSHIADNGIVNVEALSTTYSRAIRSILTSSSARRQTLWAIVVFVFVAYLLVPLGFVKNEFFPKTSENTLFVNIELSKGTKSAIVQTEMTRMIQEMKKVPYVEYVVADEGALLTGDGNRTNTPEAMVMTLHLKDKEERDVTSIELAEMIRTKFQNYTTGKLTVVEVSGGPPAGADVQLKLLGDDLSELNNQAEKLVAFLKKQEGILNPETSIKPGLSKIVFVPDVYKLAQNDISVGAIGLQLRSFASGFELDTLGTGNDEKKIIYATENNRETVDNLYGLTISNQNSSVPLVELGTLNLAYNPTLITRENAKRTISVSASVKAGYNIVEKNKDLLEYAESLDLPDGYSLQTGGVNEENNKSVQSILKAMMLAGILILITMIIEFGSYRQAAIALLIIPVSIAGVFYLFALFGIPLSFPALIGILALFGIVVTHAIVVIEKINDNREHGLPLLDAIVDAAENRLEPVLLTSLATIFGLIPITLADPLWRGLGGAIIAGLVFSGALKLFFVPVLYYNWFKDDENIG